MIWVQVYILFLDVMHPLEFGISAINLGFDLAVHPLILYYAMHPLDFGIAVHPLNFSTDAHPLDFGIAVPTSLTLEKLFLVLLSP